MIPFKLLLLVCLAYVVFLFLVAFWAERQAQAGRLRLLRSPLVYTLSLSIYCTAWTFYGAVGYAARSGLEFATIYLGPTLVFAGWWLLLRKLVRIGRQQRVTSIADLVSARYGKSSRVAVMVTLISVAAATPYIALQLRSVTLSFGVFAADVPEEWTASGSGTALWVAVGLAFFTILFGTRKIAANEQNHGVVGAIAVEAVVKLVALIAVGIWVVWFVAAGPVDMYRRIETSPIAASTLVPSRWAGLTLLSGAAIFTLPRMFQVLVVENTNERYLATAGWAFPLYLIGMSLFIVPIAVIGLEHMPAGSNPDLFVLTLPLAFDKGWLAMLAFLGGFSSATSMVIVAAIALATMVSNHIVTPLWLRIRPGVSEDLRGVVLTARRLSILGVLALGYVYYRMMNEAAALSEIGLISFVGAAQVLPALVGGLCWRGATRSGAMAGLLIGAALWAYCLLLPTLAPGWAAGLLTAGPFGFGWLRPTHLLGMDTLDPLLHALFWSMLLNTLAYIVVSLLTFPTPIERLQGVQFVNAFEADATPGGWRRSGAEAEELLVLAQRILGRDDAQELFSREAAAQGQSSLLPETTPEFLGRLERRLAGSVGAATAHAMLAQLAGRALVTVEDLMAVANETAQIMEYSSQLETKSEELARTARQLRAANEKLTALSVQKDAFLGQISHELRTPMTSIRAFSQILAEEGDLPPERQRHYAGIMAAESARLTRLLDDLLDLSVLEHGEVQLDLQKVRLGDLIDTALAAAQAGGEGPRLRLNRDPAGEGTEIVTDPGRLTQVFINLISNARKYCDAAVPTLRIEVTPLPRGRLAIDFIDNGQGIAPRHRTLVFEKFYRVTDGNRAGGAGLGLAISREVMERLGGKLSYLPGQSGAAFRVMLPRRGPVVLPIRSETGRRINLP